ncbi:Uncharacterised protein [Mycobacteroides abscessus subsp. abscessus]|nr:Uncharacterised protein [Mycobacteroides abscessus subsp. abscessus]
MPYGISTAVRTTPRPKMVRCITNARANPSTSSMSTEITVITSVTTRALHQYLSLRTVM